jgi:hypothetical protein
VKVAYVDGELLLEVHPPVDAQGQTTAEPDLDLLSQRLDKALGNGTAAIHWDFAKQTLQAANGIPTVVGLQADLDPAAPPPPASAPPVATSPQGDPAPPPSAATAPAVGTNISTSSGPGPRTAAATPPN